MNDHATQHEKGKSWKVDIWNSITYNQSLQTTFYALLQWCILNSYQIASFPSHTKDSLSRAKNYCSLHVSDSTSLEEEVKSYSHFMEKIRYKVINCILSTPTYY